MKRYIFIILFSYLSFAQINNPKDKNLKIITDVFLLMSSDKEAYNRLEKIFETNHIPMYLEILNFIQDESLQNKIISLIEEKTGEKYNLDINKWYQWLWSKKYKVNPFYAEFKAHLYSYVDPSFKAYFSYQYPNIIRLDEVRWGGVKQDGIPPLHNPKLIEADKADFMNDDDIVYGLELKGEFRAYPKRIVAWHELLTEEINGTHITGVFCSLCGTMIVYESNVNGRKFSFGTSGFLYRSNKLMYDKETNSLWSSYYGEPVTGIMTNQNLRLKKIPVTSSTWKEWKNRYPATKVLSLNTGFERNYDEGVAYKSYFESDELMFAVPEIDSRIANKTEVVSFHIDSIPYAISKQFLSDKIIYDHKNFIAVTVGSETRIYETSKFTFKSSPNPFELLDSSNQKWKITEEALILNENKILRINSHPSFWFGWKAAYPKTVLIYKKR